jgi:magnesium transporter
MKNICQLYKYDNNNLDISIGDPSDFLNIEIKDKETYWLNYHSTIQKTYISKLFDNLSIDKTTFEDIYKLQKRPKLEEYNNYIFFTIHSALPKNESNLLKKENISFILGDNYLISLQEKKSDHFTTVRDRIENKKGKIRGKGPDYLLFRMLDAITDNYFEVLDNITKKIITIETNINGGDSKTLNDIEYVKRTLLELKKIVFPMKDMTSHLEKIESTFIDNENHHYFSEVKDDCLTILDEIESNNQILDGLSNLFYAIQGQKMNEIMKLLTLVSTIFIPLTFIAGIYGMNFENMPELKWKYGYFLIWGIIIILTFSLIIFFKKKGWIKNN